MADGESRPTIRRAVAPADIYINVYPLGDLKPIPGQ